MWIKVPTRLLPDAVKQMPTTTPDEVAAKDAAATAFWAKTMFIQSEIPDEVVAGGTPALLAFQARCEADALGLTPIPGAPAPVEPGPAPAVADTPVAVPVAAPTED